ncbi:HAD family phosphatase [Kocuria flava]|uniref:HAD family hydrolase n=1 Tax=Kocuria flava TaxID=446860 RepID=UPI001FF65127|nr:HAD family phosphatase [Kocuria flava]MCJ8503686.1 HAD family phosphatase [Kocuria flava]
MAGHPEERALPAAVLFDHDGTLVDTEPLWAVAKRSVAARHGTTWHEADDLATLGRTVPESARLMLERGADGTVEGLTAELGREVAAALTGEVPFLPGVRALLDELAAAGVPGAVVTNALTVVARGTAAGAPEVLREVVSQEDVEHPKPHPEPYLLAARRLGVDPARCVAVEDSPTGAASAAAAGMPVVVVPGDVPVAPGPGLHLVDAHTDVTLDLLRSLLPPA